MQPQSEQPFERRAAHARRVGAVLAGGLCTTAAVAIWALVTGTFDSTSLAVLASALAAAGATLCGLAGATVLGRQDYRHVLGHATIFVSAVALTLAVLLIWVPSASHSESFARAFGISLVAMIACAHAALLHGRLRSDDGDATRALTKIAVGSASSAALIVSCLLLLVSGQVASAVWRFLGVLMVIAVLTTLLAPLARRIRPTSHSGEPAGDAPTGPPNRRDLNGERPRRSLMLGRQAAG